ncbi:MAG TPA: hypothetical protein DCY94_01090, partial [Firmicutes bacterium]|nr:hypothetical protein [Bacillota bacterium]
MDRKWNVDLFKNREECLEALKAIDDGIDKLKSKNPSVASADASLELIQEYFKYRDLAYRCLVYGSLSFYADTSEENAELKRLVEQKNEDTISSLSFINEMFISMGKDEIERQLDENTDLRKYRHYLDELFRKQRHEKSSEEIVSLKKSINNLIQEYNRIVLGVKFDSILVDGKEIELDNKNIAKYLASRDHETREQAYLSLNHGYQKVEDELVGLIDELYEKRNALSKLLGYRNVLEMAIDEEAIEPTILEKTIDIVHKKIELLQKYMKEKKRILGYPEPHLYDLGISLESGIKKKFPFEETIPLLDKIFEPLGEKYTAVIHRLFGENHIDSEIRDSKHQITFSWYGFSFLNYHDAYGDLKNLVHELGHSSNDLLSQHLPFPYRISSVFVGETASIVNEILLVRYLLSQSEKEDDKRYYLEKEIDNYITSV